MSEVLAKTESERAQALAKLDAIEAELGRAKLAAENFESRAISAERRIERLEERERLDRKWNDEQSVARSSADDAELSRLASEAEIALRNAIAVRPMRIREALEAANSLATLSIVSRVNGERIFRPKSGPVYLSFDELRRLLEAAEGA